MNSTPPSSAHVPPLAPRMRHVDRGRALPAGPRFAGTHFATEAGEPRIAEPEAATPTEPDDAVLELIAAALDRAARAATPPQPAPELPRARNGFD